LAVLPPNTYPGTRYAYQKYSLTVKENPPVRPKKKSTSGKKPVHSWEKLGTPSV